MTFPAEGGARPRFREELRRTVSAWGEETQVTLGRLHIGVIGAGSVGAMVGEALARTGFTRVTLIDYDTVEFVNLDRLLHARRIDARLARSKVATLGAGLRKSATAEGFVVRELEWSVTGRRRDSKRR